MDARETARLELQVRLDAAKTQAERNRLGQFATPPELPSDIFKNAPPPDEHEAEFTFGEQ